MIYVVLYRVVLLAFPSVRQLLRYAPADAGCLCDEAAVHVGTIKVTL